MWLNIVKFGCNCVQPILNYCFSDGRCMINLGERVHMFVKKI